MQHAKIIKDFHVLFVGDNGKICNGVTVQFIPESRYYGNRAYSQIYDINEHSFRQDPAHIKVWYGLSDEEYNRHLKQLEDLKEQQKK